MISSIIYTGAIVVTYIVARITYGAFKGNIRAFLKGRAGERKVNKVLKGLEKKSQGKYIHDLELIKVNGESSQLDQVYINRSGIFIIETKNYSGTIEGTENSSNWTQTINGKSRNIGNFARQNHGHIEAIKPLLKKFPSLPVYSMLSFNPDCKLNLDLDNTIATRYTTLENAIKIRSRVPVISQGQMDEIHSTLLKENVKNSFVKKTHVLRLNLQHQSDQKAFNRGLTKEEAYEELVKKYRDESNISIDLTKPRKATFEDTLGNALSRTQKVNTSKQKDNYQIKDNR